MEKLHEYYYWLFLSGDDMDKLLAKIAGDVDSLHVEIKK